MRTPTYVAGRLLTDDDIRAAVCKWELHFHQILDQSAEGAPDVAAVEVILHFLGEDWFNRHVLGQSKDVEYLHPLTDPRPRFMPGEIDRFRYSHRRRDLADMLVNFQSVKGFERRLKRLETENDIESIMAELQAAQIVFRGGVSFTFVDEIGVTGRDFDLAAILDSNEVACETKCKIEGGDVSERAIKEAVNKAREQLPKNDKACIVFLKIPQLWTRDSSLKSVFPNALEVVFRNTGRISGVVFFWEEWRHEGGNWATHWLPFGVVGNLGARIPIPNLKEHLAPKDERQWKTMRHIVRPLIGHWQVTSDG